MGKKKTRGKRPGTKIPSVNLNISNKALTAVVCVLAVVCLFAGGIYIDTFYGNGMFQKMLSQKKEPTLSEEEANASVDSMAVDISSKAAMAVFDKEFMLCTKDGVKYFASMGDQKWNDTFNMTSPAMIQEGEYVAVGDMGGKTVRVYNRSGKLYDLQAEGSPVQFALNEKGYLSLITKNDKSYRIRIYNAKGTLLKERVEESNGVYPLCADISDDSKVFAVSYLDTTDIAPVGRVVLFYIDAEQSEDHTDSMFAAVEKTDEIIPVISYMDKGVLVAISDLNVYGIGGDGTELWEYPLENTIDQAALGNKEYIVLALGDSVANKDGKEKGTVHWLDINGKDKASFETGESVTYLHAGKKGVVVGNDHRYTGVGHSGNESWQYVATGDLTDLIPMEKLNIAMAVGKDQVIIYNMSKMKNGQAEVGKLDAEEAADTPDGTADSEGKTEAPKDSVKEKSDTKDSGKEKNNTEKQGTTDKPVKSEE